MADPDRRPGYLQTTTTWRMVKEIPPPLWGLIGGTVAVSFGLGWVWRRFRQ